MARQHSTITNANQEKTINDALNILLEQLKAPQSDLLNSPEKVKNYLMLKLAHEEREVFLAMFLDTKNRLIHSEILFYGTLNQTPVYPREVIKMALLHNAASVIVAHNHPTGLVEPSKADISLTKVLTDALAVVDIRLLDHIIVATDKAYSFKENNTLANEEKKDCEIDHTKKSIEETANYIIDFNSGVSKYIKAFADNNREELSFIGNGVSESAFTGLATVGKLIAYSDLREMDTSEIGWLVVMLAELGINASRHSKEAFRG